MTDRIDEIRARCEAILNDLKQLLPPQVDYAKLVGAESWAHGQCYVWEEPEPYAMYSAIGCITDLLNCIAEQEAEIKRLRIAAGEVEQ